MPITLAACDAIIQPARVQERKRAAVWRNGGSWGANGRLFAQTVNSERKMEGARAHLLHFLDAPGRGPVTRAGKLAVACSPQLAVSLLSRQWISYLPAA